MLRRPLFDVQKAWANVFELTASAVGRSRNCAAECVYVVKYYITNLYRYSEEKLKYNGRSRLTGTFVCKKPPGKCGMMKCVEDINVILLDFPTPETAYSARAHLLWK